MKKFKFDWKPRKHGDVYCSPSCGGGCKHNAYLKAKLKSSKLAKKLGKGWKPIVTENLGWHWNVVCGKVAVYEAHAGYKACIANQYWQHGGTARDAINAVLLAMRSHINELSDQLEEICGNLNQTKMCNNA